MKQFYLIILIGLLVIKTGQAQEEENDVKDAAQNATNPLAFLTKLQVQPNYTLKDNGGDQLTLITRIMQPKNSIDLPFIKSKAPY